MIMFKYVKYFLLLCIVSILSACGGGSGSDSDDTPVVKPTKPVVILVFGDSISQGYGYDIYGEYFQQITPGNTFTELLRQRVKKESLDEFASVTVYNDSLGGETAKDAVNRIQNVLAYYRPTHIVLAHGTNDAGANVALSTISTYFISMSNSAKAFGAKVMIADVTPTLYGDAFATNYSIMVSDTAKAAGATYVPLLDDVKGNSSLYWPDGVHPKDSAQSTMSNNLWKSWLTTLN
jgi:lysophospholipase L1-like esterase